MEAQKLITMSINKIAGSRRQRGGINLRKNLLVASVLHSARIHYYEEMCNRMPGGSIALEQSQPESSMDDDEDCTDSPDWDSDDENVETEEDVCGEEEDEYEGCADNETAGKPACEREASRVVVEPVLPVVPCERVAAASAAESDKENVDPAAASVGHSIREKASENYGYYTTNTRGNTADSPSNDCDRVALGESHNSNSAVDTCTTTTCLVIPSVKRKRTETEEACDSIIAVSSCKRAKVDSQCQTLSSDCGAQSSISTLVDIFKAGFHGLAGESGGKLTASSNYEETDSTSSSSTPSYTTLSTHSRPFETLQTAVIAAC